MSGHAEEIRKGERFQFGANWQEFLSTLNEERIREAQSSLMEMIGLDSLAGKRFLDVGSGSGLFSLAARNLGAEVVSFDYDPQSVACTNRLKTIYHEDDRAWSVHQGSVLDRAFLESLGSFDIVYSWGVLHHTGNMLQSLENAIIPLADQGILFIAIYNDQGMQSRLWGKVKKTYCSGLTGRLSVQALFVPVFFLQAVMIGLLRYQNPFGVFNHYKTKRGMSVKYDWIDWLGGYPFEVAKPEEIFRFYKKRGLVLENFTTTNKIGCNQFVFKKTAD